MGVSMDRVKAVAEVQHGVIDPWFKAAKRSNADKQLAIETAARRMVDQLKKTVGTSTSLTEELLWIALFAGLAALPAAGQFLALSYAFVAKGAGAAAGKLRTVSIGGMRTFKGLPQCESFWIKYESASKVASSSPGKELIALGADGCRNAISRVQQATSAIDKNTRAQAAKSKTGSVSIENLKDPIVNFLDAEAKLWDDQNVEWNLVLDDMLDKDEVTFRVSGNKFKKHVNAHYLKSTVKGLLGAAPGFVERNVLEEQFEFQLWRSYFSSAVVILDYIVGEQGVYRTSKGINVLGLREDDIKYLGKFKNFSESREGLVWMGASVKTLPPMREPPDARPDPKRPMW